MGGNIVKATPEAIAEAAAIIKSGGLVAFPTETVYGLGANALDSDAVERIFRAKGRPQDNPLILHVANIREAAKYAEINPTAEVLMHQFWPGPLTLVMYALECVPEITRGYLDTVALRMPMNPVALALIRETGLPLAAPSANKSGRPSPTTAEVVADDLRNAVDMILDDGPTSIGLESTVADTTGDAVAILRPGGITREMLAQIADLCEEEDDRLALRSPGTRYRHYAPALPLLLWTGEDLEMFERIAGMKWCYMGIQEPPAGSYRKIIFHSMEEYARKLFLALRELESCGGGVIVAEQPKDSGIGSAIRNRLSRAAGR